MAGWTHLAENGSHDRNQQVRTYRYCINLGAKQSEVQASVLVHSLSLLLENYRKRIYFLLHLNKRISEDLPKKLPQSCSFKQEDAIDNLLGGPGESPVTAIELYFPMRCWICLSSESKG